VAYAHADHRHLVIMVGLSCVGLWRLFQQVGLLHNSEVNEDHLFE
jgi:hypothetical protein